MRLRVAVIDSGINFDHPHVGGKPAGLGIFVNEAGTVERTSGFRDEIGHGTAIAGLIRYYAPEAHLIAVKIFRRELSTSAPVLLDALRYALDENVNIIHLSLGLTGEKHRAELETVCLEARERSVVVVASARGPGDRVFPAAFESVVGVYGNPDCGFDELVHHPGGPIEFGAHVQPRPLPGLPQERNFKGHSFAAAHVSGRAAAILCESPNTSPNQVKSELVRLSKDL